MIPASASSTLVTNLKPENSRSATIIQTPEAFKILTKDIYQHIIPAFIRESITNAVDSHIEAGKSDVAVKVNLPTELKPFFEVEDFGIGLQAEMSEEDPHPGVQDTFITFFGSTKRNTNKTTGAKGLGSKVAYQYNTMSMMIIARYNGMERHFTCFIDEQGLPTSAMVLETPTDKCNGVKISIPVRESDIETVCNEAAFIIGFFDAKIDVNYQTFKPLVSPELAQKLFDGEYISFEAMSYSKLYTTGIYFWSGGVCYKIPRSNIQETLNKHAEVITNNAKKNQTIRDIRLLMSLTTSGFHVLPVPLGMLNPHASRESLSMEQPDLLPFYLELLNKVKGTVRDILESYDKIRHPLLMEKFKTESGVSPYAKTAVFGEPKRKSHMQFVRSKTWRRMGVEDMLGNFHTIGISAIYSLWENTVGNVKNNAVGHQWPTKVIIVENFYSFSEYKQKRIKKTLKDKHTGRDYLMVVVDAARFKRQLPRMKRIYDFAFEMFEFIDANVINQEIIDIDRQKRLERKNAPRRRVVKSKTEIVSPLFTHHYQNSDTLDLGELQEEYQLFHYDANEVYGSAGNFRQDFDGSLDCSFMCCVTEFVTTLLADTLDKPIAVVSMNNSTKDKLTEAGVPCFIEFLAGVSKQHKKELKTIRRALHLNSGTDSPTKTWMMNLHRHAPHLMDRSVRREYEAYLDVVRKYNTTGLNTSIAHSTIFSSTKTPDVSRYMFERFVADFKSKFSLSSCIGTYASNQQFKEYFDFCSYMKRKRK